MAIDEKVNITATADTNQALTALQAIDASLQKVAARGDKVAQATGVMFSAATEGAGVYQEALKGISTATNLMDGATSAALKTLRELRAFYRDAAGEQNLFADSQRRLAGVLQPGQLQGSTQRIQTIASQYGVKPNVLTAAAENVLGSLGGLSQEHGMAAVEQAAAYRPGETTSSGELSAIAQSILSLQKQDSSITATGAMAFIRSALRASRVNSIEEFSVNLLPQIANSRAFGGGQDNMKYLASLAIGVGDSADDPTGKKTATGMGGFLKQIKAATADKLGPTASVQQQMEWLHNTEEGTAVRKKLLGPMFGKGADAISGMGGDMGSLLEGIAGVDAGKILLHGDNKTWLPLVELLQNGDNRTKRAVAAASAGMYDVHDPRGIAEMQSAEAELMRSPYQQTAATKRAFSSAKSQAQLSNSGALIGLEQDFDDTMRAVGVPWFHRTGFDAARWWRGGGAKGHLQSMQGEALAVANNPDLQSYASESDRTENNRLLREMVEKLGRQIELMERPQNVNVNLGDGPTERGQVQAAQRAGQN